ncbi:AzlD domain-containing protein [Roseomonas sp. GC11]|uniref:AzlD family protein n=1 Tax=Roseomonas sp. GC11 TaxID=2950546 RepID=UPI00210B43FA|nr:AzlD domain-containing protein [Roseomonas sp. GC11]MCQ4162803.1 AzlD domain-containing protein [Roseomonas sp. GC11]
MRPDVLAAILGMAAVTYLCRAGGYAVLRAVRPPPFVEAMLRNLPGPIFTAYVALALDRIGWPGVAGSAAVILVQRATGNLSASIITGVAAVWAAQLVF